MKGKPSKYIQLKSNIHLSYSWESLSLAFVNWQAVLVSCGMQILAIALCLSLSSAGCVGVWFTARLTGSFTNWVSGSPEKFTMHEAFWLLWHRLSSLVFSSSNSFQFFSQVLFSFFLPCFLCVSVSVHSLFLLSLRHIFRPLLLWWWTPWRSLWWDWPFHIKWVHNRIQYLWPDSTLKMQEGISLTSQSVHWKINMFAASLYWRIWSAQFFRDRVFICWT